MRKLTLFLIVCLACFMNGFAVNPFADDLSQLRKNTLTLTPKVGMTYSNMSQDKATNLFDGGACGFVIGATLETRFGRITEESPAGSGLLGLSLGLQYSMNNVKTNGVDEKGASSNLSLSSLDVPVSVRVYPLAKDLHLSNLYIEAGVSMSLNMGCEPASLTVEGTSANVESITYHFKDGDKNLKANDLKPLIGIGYSLPTGGFGASFRYYMGMSKIAGNLPSKLSCAELSIFWQFKLCKY